MADVSCDAFRRLRRASSAARLDLKWCNRAAHSWPRFADAVTLPPDGRKQIEYAPASPRFDVGNQQSAARNDNAAVALRGANKIQTGGPLVPPDNRQFKFDAVHYAAS